MTIRLKDFIPYQDHYYILKLQRPGSHGKYAVHGGPTADDPDKIGLLVFPLLEKAEQYVLMLAKPTKDSPAVLSIPIKVSTEQMLSLAYDVGGIALNDPHSQYVHVLEFDKSRGKGVFIRALKEDVHTPMYLLTHQGRVQRYERPEGSGVIFARSEKAAKHAAEEIKKNTGMKVAVAEIGTIPGETLEGHIRHLMEAGDLGTWTVVSEEGPLKMSWLPFAQESDSDALGT